MADEQHVPSLLSLPPDVVARLNPTRAHYSLKGFKLGGFLFAPFRSAFRALMPYSEVVPPRVSQADFPDVFPPDVHELLVAAQAQEEQRTTRLDAKASAFLSTSGILIPLITTVLTLIQGTPLKSAFFVSVLLSTISGIAAFRALQLKRAEKLGVHVAIDGSGVIRVDTRTRHTINLLYVLKTDEAVNDHRSNLLGASSTLLAASTMVLFFASVVLVLGFI